MAGELRVRVWDDDVKSEDEALGSAVLTIALSPAGANAPVSVEKLTLKGREQEGTAGYVLPDFEVSFSYELAKE